MSAAASCACRIVRAEEWRSGWPSATALRLLTLLPLSWLQFSGVALQLSCCAAGAHGGRPSPAWHDPPPDASLPSRCARADASYAPPDTAGRLEPDRDPACRHAREDPCEEERAEAREGAAELAADAREAALAEVRVERAETALSEQRDPIADPQPLEQHETDSLSA